MAEQRRTFKRADSMDGSNKDADLKHPEEDLELKRHADDLASEKGGITGEKSEFLPPISNLSCTCMPPWTKSRLTPALASPQSSKRQQLSPSQKPGNSSRNSVSTASSIPILIR